MVSKELLIFHGAAYYWSYHEKMVFTSKTSWTYLATSLMYTILHAMVTDDHAEINARACVRNVRVVRNVVKVL